MGYGQTVDLRTRLSLTKGWQDCNDLVRALVALTAPGEYGHSKNFIPGCPVLPPANGMVSGVSKTSFSSISFGQTAGGKINGVPLRNEKVSRQPGGE